MIRNLVLAGAFSVVLYGLPYGALLAQCRPAADSHEARLLAFYSGPVTFSADPAATALAWREIRLSAEVVPMPKPSGEIQQTGTCFTQKSENTHLTPVFGRPRFAIGLGSGLVAEASYLPPVRVGDATPNLAGIAVSRSMRVGGISGFVRLHGVFGSVKGPITCPKEALQTDDPEAPCYGSRESRDTFRPRVFGVEVGGGTGWRNEKWMVNGGMGINALRPRFQVGFTDEMGNVDRTEIEVNLTRVMGFVGAAYKVGGRCDVGGQVNGVVRDLVMACVVVGCRVR